MSCLCPNDKTPSETSSAQGLNPINGQVDGQVGIPLAAMEIPTSLKDPRGGLRSPRISSICPVCTRETRFARHAEFHVIIHLFLAWVSTRQSFISKAFGISGNPLLTFSMGRNFL